MISISFVVVNIEQTNAATVFPLLEE